MGGATRSKITKPRPSRTCIDALLNAEAQRARPKQQAGSPRDSSGHPASSSSSCPSQNILQLFSHLFLLSACSLLLCYVRTRNTCVQWSAQGVPRTFQMRNFANFDLIQRVASIHVTFSPFSPLHHEKETPQCLCEWT